MIKRRSGRCVIVCGAHIDEYGSVRRHLREDDFFIFCDGGLDHAEGLGVLPDLIVGDFDSHEKPHTDIETIELPREKDDTDSMFAAKEAVRRGFGEVLFIGAAGGRLDHTLANLSILLMLDSMGVRAALADEYSIVEPVSGSACVEPGFKYFSLLAAAGDVEGVTIEGAKYPLHGARITPEYQYGVSNETIGGTTARISVKEGRALLIKVMQERQRGQ